MKAFRRSTKSLGGSGESKHHHISIPQKDAIAIVPPKKVIKALYDYHPDNTDNRYLGFSQGDFLHVVSRENDPDWYEACNPILNTRGLVPVNYFELISKQVRNSGGMEPVQANTQQQMNLVDRTVNGNRIQSMQNGHDSGYGGTNGTTMEPQESTLRMSKLGRQSGAMVYGMVLYDFKAERTDELQASAGEAIIVIAQSNPEWFVAKPITRLGGPGLIPVSFIEIRDMTTGKAVPDPYEAVQRAGVPKVEEWKRMAASYKNSSIPLGKLGSSVEEEPARGSPNSQQMSGGYENQQQQENRYSRMSTPLRARVPRYCHHEMKFWFVVEAYMDDGKYWELNREYTDFYALQTALMEQFPEASGKVQGQKRSLPYMPGPLPWVTERLTSERREHMDKYLVQLLQLGQQSDLGQRIVVSYPVKDFFVPRDGDVETEGLSETDSEWVRLSQGSSQQSVHPPQDSRQSSSGNLSSNNNNNQGAGYASPGRTQGNYAPTSPGHHRNNSDTRNGNGYGAAGGASYGMPPPPTSNGPKVKVKAFLGESNIVILRMDEGFDFQQLLDKVRERWQLEHPGRHGVENFAIDYKDDGSGSFYPLISDGDLRRAMSTSEKLTVRVSVDHSY